MTRDPEVLKVREFAQRVRVNYSTALRMVQARLVRSIRTGGNSGTYRIPVEEVATFLNGGGAVAQPPKKNAPVLQPKRLIV